ncbi:MAG: DUF4153 domain-containing protein [Gemmatimonadales bacterium]|nr:MAG: DUF4153 domain-containing protein [Gemmatimonadales bacterium]
MRFPSVKLLASAASASFARFPFVLVAAFVATVTAMLAIEDVGEDTAPRLLTAALLGLPLFTALVLWGERRAWRSTTRLAAGLAGVAALAAYYLLWPQWSPVVAFTRFAQFLIALHLLVAFLPYLGVGEPNGFWQYNRTLFLRFLTAALYAAVLFVGLVIALVALDKLLGVDIPDKSYAHLWFLIAGVFHPWVFLSGVPDDYSALDQLRDYPLGLKVLAQYILMPIVLIYLVILTVYMGKIIGTGVWPSGWIGYLVSSVATVGILSLLLLHPIQEQAENLWVQSYARWFYVALFPSIIMLVLAIWKRVQQYGFTERRYFLVVLAAWLFGVALYYSIRRSKNIKVIPASLCAVALITSFGPWSAYRVSVRSQTSRLASHLTEAGLLAAGRVRPASGDVAFEHRREISEILTYLIGTHGSGTVARWFPEERAIPDTSGADPAKRQAYAIQRTQVIMQGLNLGYVSAAEAREPSGFYYTTGARSVLAPVEGYDYVYHLARIPSDTLSLGDRHLRVALDSAAGMLQLLEDQTILIALPIEPLIDRVRAYLGEHPMDRNALPPDLMRVEGENERVAVRVYVSQLSGRRIERGTAATQVRGEVLLRLK